MAILNNSNAISSGGYDINNSLRFRASASAYLNRTPTSTGNRQTFTISTWVKRGTVGARQHIFISANPVVNTGGQQELQFAFDSSDRIEITGGVSGVGQDLNLTTTQVFRDPSAWYHLVVSIDTTQATSSNRMKFYVNGVQVTAFGTAIYPSQNHNTAVNLINFSHRIGGSGGSYLDGYQTEINLIDGQALTPSSFGETDAITGSWVAKKYTGTYGTNGFYLPFTSNSNTAYAVYTTNMASNYHSLPTGSQGTNFTFTGDMTLEGWVLFPSSSADNSFYVQYDGTNYFALNIDISGGNYTVYASSTTPTATISHGITVGNWTHVAMVRSGSTITLYTNGVARGSFTNSSTLGFSSLSLNRFGGGAGGTRYISNLRMTKSAIYTSNFVPPTTALTNVANTVVLTYQNSTAIDNSSNGYTLTATGSPSLVNSNLIWNANVVVDASGNKNTWTPNNLNYSTAGTTYDAMLDVPTNTSATVANYAVMSPIDWVSASGTLSSANLNWASSANSCGNRSTIGVTSGKWYWEAIGSSVTSGTVGGRFGFTGNDTTAVEQDKFGMYWHPTSGIARIVNGTNTYVTSSYTYTNSDVLALALDLDNNISYWYKNGVLQYTYDFSSYSTIGARIFHAYVWNASSGTPSWVYNFGQRPFSYTPRTNHVALNTYNLPDSTIKKGNSYMDATLYTGNGANRSITNASSFRPDLVIGQARSAAYGNWWFDSVRGATKQIASFGTYAESTQSTMLTAFNSDGFSMGTDTAGNGSGTTFVAWQWQAGQGSTSSNTQGSITSTVSVNTTAGFSIITYAGSNSSPNTIGHGLGVAPKLWIIKNRSSGSGNWVVNYIYTDNGVKYAFLNTTAGGSAQGSPWSTLPTSSVITLGGNDVNTCQSGSNYVCYAFAEISGFSKIGFYTGNGSSDGPFNYLGFRPKFVMVKRVDASGTPWVILDSVRNTYNPENLELYPNTSSAEASGGTTYIEDFLSNGFKIRQTDVTWNASGGTYLYMAFAENPFKNANAR
jgi:Concanavalin A-like lectin/glucanases superfamily